MLPDRRRAVPTACAALAAALVLGLAACGGGPDERIAAGDTASTAAPSTTTASEPVGEAGVPVVADPPVLDPPTRPGGEGPVGPDLPEGPDADDDADDTDDEAAAEPGVSISDGRATGATTSTTSATGTPTGVGTGPATGTGTAIATTSTTADDDGHRQVSVLALQVGMCFLDPGRSTAGQPTEVATLEVVPCEEEHDHEVVALWNDDAAPGSPFPGRAALVADAACLLRLADYSGLDPLAEGLDALPITPEAATWAQGDRAIGCYAHRFDGAPTSGSLRAG